MPSDARNTVLDEATGARRLAISPAPQDVLDYFATRYYADIAAGEKAVDIKRSQDGGEAARAQAAWMRDTLYADIADAIATHAPGRRVVEVGCGLGDLLADLQSRGFETTGVEIAPEAAAHARGRGLAILEGAFETLDVPTCDAILFVNVLEQMSDPAAVIARAREILAPGGIVLVRSGNDFNPLQLALRDRLGKGEYWVVEDHVWYFGYDSLEALMRHAGLEPTMRRSDFPMELFPLMGLDYTSDPAIGRAAHAQRVALETNLPPETRRALYDAFAAAGLGRCATVVGKKPSGDPS